MEAMALGTKPIHFAMTLNGGLNYLTTINRASKVSLLKVKIWN